MRELNEMREKSKSNPRQNTVQAKTERRSVAEAFRRPSKNSEEIKRLEAKRQVVDDILRPQREMERIVDKIDFIISFKCPDKSKAPYLIKNEIDKLNKLVKKNPNWKKYVKEELEIICEENRLNKHFFDPMCKWLKH